MTAVVSMVGGTSTSCHVVYEPSVAGSNLVTTWQDVEVPPTMDTTAVINYQTNLWSTTDHGRLVWSAMSHTTDAFSTQLIEYQTESLLLPEMAKSGSSSDSVWYSMS